MEKKLLLYHGSNNIIKEPLLGKGNRENDYGQGFYCTEHRELACEWASKRENVKGYANEYTLTLDGLQILDLMKPEYNILHWITILLQNRTFTVTSDIAREAKKYLTENFAVDVADYDIIRGYRADDSYFSFARDFINNTISVQKLARAMKLGKLGIQYMLRTEQAFNQLEFTGAEEVDGAAYYAKYLRRDLKARNDYKNSRGISPTDSGQLYIMDIIRGGIKNGDSRL